MLARNAAPRMNGEVKIAPMPFPPYEMLSKLTGSKSTGAKSSLSPCSRVSADARMTLLSMADIAMIGKPGCRPRWDSSLGGYR